MELVTSLMGGGNTAYIIGGAVLALVVLFFFVRSKFRKWKKKRATAHQVRIEREANQQALNNLSKKHQREVEDLERSEEIQNEKDSDHIKPDLIR